MTNPAVAERIVDFPTCGDWLCDDPDHFQVVEPGDPEWAGVRSEERVLFFHSPRGEWREALTRLRSQNGGRPMWERRVADLHAMQGAARRQQVRGQAAPGAAVPLVLLPAPGAPAAD